MLSKRRRVRIVFDFYEVVDTSSQKRVSEILDHLSATNQNQREKLTTEIFGEDVIIVDMDFDQRNGYYFASLVKLRPQDRIGIYKYGGERRDIRLEDDEFVGEEVSFLYDPSMKIMTLQRNRYGVSASGVEAYFQYFSGSGYLTLRPVFTPDTYQKLLRQKVIHAIETEIAIPDSEVFLDGKVEGWAVPDLQKLKEQLGALKIGMILTVDDARKSKLDFRTAVRLVKGFMSSKQTTKLKTRVRETEKSSIEDLNMFDDLVRIEYWKTLPSEHTLSTFALQQMAAEAYADKKEELQRLFVSNRGE